MGSHWDRLEYLLSVPSDISIAYLKVWPSYDPLHDHPGFQALIEKYEKEHELRS